MSDLSVLMVPHWNNIQGHAESGIKRVVEKYFAHLPSYGIKLVGANASSFDLLAVHAGMSNRHNANIPIVAHVHGLYWHGDYETAHWQAKANRDVIESIRYADSITVPTGWVAECLKRDMHITPHVVPHGVDWEEWQGESEDDGYVIFNKNRDSDACDPRPVVELAQRFPQVRFMTTFAPTGAPPNIKVTGTVPHAEMKRMVMRSTIYLATTKETWGLATMEAMATGKPILGFDWGGTKELVQHGVNGYLARPGDYHELAEGLAYVMAHRKVLGENSRSLAREWTWEKACTIVARVYRGAMKTWGDIHSRSFTIPEEMYRVEQDT